MTAEPVRSIALEGQSIELYQDMTSDNYPLTTSGNTSSSVQKPTEALNPARESDSRQCAVSDQSNCNSVTAQTHLSDHSAGKSNHDQNYDRQPQTTRSALNPEGFRKSLLLPDEDPSTANSRTKQLLNTLYFLSGTACATIFFFQFQHSGAFQLYFCCLMLPLLGFFAIITGMAIRFSLREPKASDFPYSFSRATRKKLRITALLTPLPFITAAAFMLASSAEYSRGALLADAQRHSDAMNHLQKAVVLNPFNKLALAKMAYSENCLFHWQESVKDADRAIAMDTREPTAWADKAWALNKMGKYLEALPVGRKACDLDPSNGEAFASLADTYYGLGQYDKALVASTRHILLHNNESNAFSQRAEILEKLGRVEEANRMQDKANLLTSTPQETNR